MKLMKLFLTGVLALSALAPSATMSMEPAPKPTGAATAAEVAQAQTCAICHDELTNGQNIRTLRCNANGVPHIFHRQCINEWLVSRQRDNQPALCPMCQTPAVPEFTLKEQLIAKAEIVNYQHNPLSMYNRRLTAHVAGLSATAVGATVLLLPLISKHFGSNISYRKTLIDFGPWFSKIATPMYLLANYIIMKYLLKDINGRRPEPQHIIASRSLWTALGLIESIGPAAIIALLLQFKILKVD